MLSLAADENVNADILRGVRRLRRDLDIVQVQEAGLAGAADPTVLAWAASEGRVLLTHDVRTMTRHAYERVAAGLPMPGVFEVRRGIPLQQIIEDVLILAECSAEGEWAG